jgi:hypothetical protein
MAVFKWALLMWNRWSGTCAVSAIRHFILGWEHAIVS